MNYSFLAKLATILFVVVFINAFMPRVNYYLFNRNKLKRLQHGITSRQDIFDLESITIDRLIKNFLLYEGYTRIEKGGINKTSDVNYTAMLHDARVYVAYKMMDLSTSGDVEANIPKIGLTDLESLLGRMAHDGIHKGVFITNGNFSKDTLQFVKGFDNEFEITLIDGIQLTREIADLKNYYNPKGELIYG